MSVYSILDEIDPGVIGEIIVITDDENIVTHILVPAAGVPRKKSVESYLDLIFVGDLVGSQAYLRDLLDGYVAFTSEVICVRSLA